MKAQDIIKKLDLKPLPEEGGFYKETFRDSRRISAGALPHHSGERSYSTCIYYLITPEEFSGLHAVKSTEIFHFYLGDPVRMIQINPEGTLSEIILGQNVNAGYVQQIVVPPEVWQGTRLLGDGQWALLGCTVTPGFEFDDFLGGTFQSLSRKFPQHSAIIREFCHK